LNFIVFLLGSLAVIVGIILIIIKRKDNSLNFISAKINNIKERPIKYYGIVIFIGLILMVTGAVTMKGNKALALEDDVKILEENVEDLNQKMLNSKAELIKKEDKLKEKKDELGIAEKKIESLEDEIIQLTILSESEKKLLAMNYGELSGDERKKVNTILDNAESYNDENKKLINDNKDRIEKEKELLKKKEREEKEKKEKEKKEKEEKEKREREEAEARKAEEEAAQEEREASETLSEKNAIQKAKDYLNYTSFSKKGLIEQLEFSGFTNEESVYAVSQIEVDWKEQAALKAQDYLDYSSFSRSSLIDQLEFTGFTNEEAVYGVNKVEL